MPSRSSARPSGDQIIAARINPASPLDQVLDLTELPIRSRRIVLEQSRFPRQQAQLHAAGKIVHARQRVGVCLGVAANRQQ